MSELVTLHNQDKVTLLVENKTNVITVFQDEKKPNLITIFRGEKGDPGFAQNESILSPSYNPDGIYNLLNIPINPSTTKVFVNGVKQVYGIDYTIVGVVLRWISPNLDLSATDIIEVYQ